MHAGQARWRKACERESSETMHEAIARESEASIKMEEMEVHAAKCERQVQQCAVRIIKGVMTRQRVVLFTRLLQRWNKTARHDNRARMRMGQPQVSSPALLLSILISTVHSGCQF